MIMFIARMEVDDGKVAECDFSFLLMHQAHFEGLNDVFYVCELCDAHCDDVKMRVMLTEMCHRKCRT